MDNNTPHIDTVGTIGEQDQIAALKRYVDERFAAYDMAAQKNIEEILNLVPQIVLDTIMAYADKKDK